MRLSVILSFLCILFLLISPAFAQESDESSGEDPGGGEDVIMLEQEIRIEVQPELPTLLVTIPRQNPILHPEKIQPPIENLIKRNTDLIKPELTGITVSQIEHPQKMLAKKRSR